MTQSGYVSAEEIIADVTSIIDDQHMRELSKGFHLSQIQQALAELAFDTYFDDKVWTTPVTDNLIIDAPKGLVSIDGMFVFPGTECEAGAAQKVHYASGYVRYGNSVFRNDRPSQMNDPIYGPLVLPSTAVSILYYGLLDGAIFLSDACSAFGTLMIKGRGMGCEFGSAPVIPNELREAVKNKAAMAALTVLLARDPNRWNLVLMNIKRDHFGGQGTFDVGTWKQAARRVQNMGNDQITAVNNYLTTLGVKN